MPTDGFVGRGRIRACLRASASVVLVLAMFTGCAGRSPGPIRTVTPLAVATSTTSRPTNTLPIPCPSPDMDLIASVAATATPTVTPIPTVQSEPTPPEAGVTVATSTTPAATLAALAGEATEKPVPPAFTNTPLPPADTPPAATDTPSPPMVTPSAAPTATPESMGETPAANQGRVVLAYYVPYDGSSWASLAAQADKIDYVAAQWMSIDACGNIGSQDDMTLVQFARSRGIKILPSLLTSSGSPNHELLTDEASAANAIQQITNYIVNEGYDGLDLDLEGVPAEDRRALTSFVARLSQSLHGQGKLLTMAVPAKTRDVTTGWAGPYDYAALAPYVDLFVIMSYSYTSAGGPPGSIAPYDWVDRSIAFATSQIPAERVLMGVGFWGYDWNVTQGGTARSLRYPAAEALASWYGVGISLDPATRSATFSYTAGPTDEPTLPSAPGRPQHQIVTHSRPACDKTPPPPPPGPTSTPTPVPEGPQSHVVWLENSESVAARLEIANRYHVAGIAAWRLGQEDPAVWSLLAEWK